MKKIMSIFLSAVFALSAFGTGAYDESAEKSIHERADI